MIQPLIRHFAARDELTLDDEALLRSMRIRTRDIARGGEIMEAHSWPTENCVLLSGVAARELMRGSGARQLTSLHFAGDMLDPLSHVLKQIDHTVIALTDCSAAFILHNEMLRVSAASQHLAHLFMMSAGIDAAIQRAWIACMGRSTAEERVAHALCEIYRRLEVVGLAADWRFDFALTQGVFADCLGLSGVHVNRSLQRLRAKELLAWHGSSVELLNWDGLARLAAFDATYLNLTKVPR